MQKINQQMGTNIVTIALVILGVAVASLTIWKLVDPNRNLTQNLADQKNQQERTDLNKGYVLIKEWGVRFRAGADLGNIVYFRPLSLPEMYDGFAFSTEELIAKEPNCGPNSNTYPLGLVIRSKEGVADAGGVIADIDGYTYQFRVNGSACSTLERNLSFESETGFHMIQTLKSLERAK